MTSKGAGDSSVLRARGNSRVGAEPISGGLIYFLVLPAQKVARSGGAAAAPPPRSPRFTGAKGGTNSQILTPRAGLDSAQPCVTGPWEPRMGPHLAQGWQGPILPLPPRHTSTKAPAWGLCPPVCPPLGSFSLHKAEPAAPIGCWWPGRWPSTCHPWSLAAEGCLDLPPPGQPPLVPTSGVTGAGEPRTGGKINHPWVVDPTSQGWGGHRQHPRVLGAPVGAQPPRGCEQQEFGV